MGKNKISKWALLMLALVLAGCSQTYPEDRVKEAIREICRKEYGIQEIQVKIMGQTVGVFLPVKKLFAIDLKEALTKGNVKIGEIENLFQPAPEALDQVEDVLFSISRVLLSTEMKLNFYVLQAADVENTGLQLTLSGFVDDIKRVRLWDISREEYRKRFLHELRVNRAVIWHRPVKLLFQTLEKSPSLKIIQEYFAFHLDAETFKSYFFYNPDGFAGPVRWRLGEFRSTAVTSSEVLVHVPVILDYDPAVVPAGTVGVRPGTALDYIFVISFASERAQVTRMIPLFEKDNMGVVRKIEKIDGMDVAKDLESWESEFMLTEIQLGNYLAEQLTRRTQNLVIMDERIQNTFESMHLTFRYEKESKETNKNYFSLDLEVRPKSHGALQPDPSALDEDVLYLLSLTSREFVDLVRSYRFTDYEFLQLKLVSDPVARILAKEDLELFRRNKIDLKGLLILGLAGF